MQQFPDAVYRDTLTIHVNPSSLQAIAYIKELMALAEYAKRWYNTVFLPQYIRFTSFAEANHTSLAVSSWWNM